MGREGAPSTLDRPVRTCIGCRRHFAQRHLIRFAVAGTAVEVDVSRRRQGRGAYLCHDPDCARRVLGDGRRLIRALRVGNDSVTVDVGTLLQDWEAERRRHPDARGKTMK